MNVMYIACNPESSDSLLVEKEITELQRLLGAARGEPVHLLSYPHLSIEQLPIELNKIHPDIVHISAHAETNYLEMANAAGQPVRLTGEMLAVFLHFPHSPQLVYLNACESQEIARKLTSVVRFAVGTTRRS